VAGGAGGAAAAAAASFLEACRDEAVAVRVRKRGRRATLEQAARDFAAQALQEGSWPAASPFFEWVLAELPAWSAGSPWRKAVQPVFDAAVLLGQGTSPRIESGLISNVDRPAGGGGGGGREGGSKPLRGDVARWM